MRSWYYFVFSLLWILARSQDIKYNIISRGSARCQSSVKSRSSSYVVELWRCVKTLQFYGDSWWENQRFHRNHIRGFVKTHTQGRQVLIRGGSSCSAETPQTQWFMVESECKTPHLTLLNTELSWMKRICALSRSVRPVCTYASAARLQNKTQQGDLEPLQSLTQRNWRKAMRRGGKDTAVLRVTLYDSPDGGTTAASI